MQQTDQSPTVSAGLPSGESYLSNKYLASATMNDFQISQEIALAL
jgi:hypothetical protein